MPPLDDGRMGKVERLRGKNDLRHNQPRTNLAKPVGAVLFTLDAGAPGQPQKLSSQVVHSGRRSEPAKQDRSKPLRKNKLAPQPEPIRTHLHSAPPRGIRNARIDVRRNVRIWAAGQGNGKVDGG